MKDEVVYSVQDFADMFKISKNTVYAMIKRGDLQAYQVGNKIRISSEEIAAYKERSLKSKVGRKRQQKKNYVISGHDAALDILGQRLQQKGFCVSRVFQNSMVSLEGLRQGKVQVAATHLWNSKTGIYNVDAVRKMFPKQGILLIRLFHRQQGFYVVQGNPKKLQTWEDLQNSDVVLVKREQGSGAERLLTEKLRQSEISLRDINICPQVANSTFELVQTIADGIADVGLDKASAILSDKVNFVPLHQECYDLVVDKEHWQEDFYKELYRIICSKEYRQELNAYGIYDLEEMGNIIIDTGEGGYQNE